MTREHISRVVDAFARGAADARRLGFDGVEIHGRPWLPDRPVFLGRH